MGEVLLSRRKSNFEPVSGAVLEVETFENRSITVTCKSTDGEMMSKVSNGLVKFNVSCSTWTVSCTVDGKEYKKQVNVDAVKLYRIVLRGMTYGVQIDMSETPYTTAYIDDAEGFKPFDITKNENPSWDTIISEFIGCRPCMVKDGVRTKYLQVNDYTKYEDGTDADITSGDEGIAMVEFKKTWYKYSVNNDILKFEVADYDRSKDGFVQDAFRSIEDSSVVKDYLYYAALPCMGLSGKGVYIGTSYDPETTYSSVSTKYGFSYGLEDWTRRMYISGLLFLLRRTPTTGEFHSWNWGGYGPDGNTKYKYKAGCRNTAGLFADANNSPTTVYESIPPKMLGIEGFFTGRGDPEYFIYGLMSGLPSSTSPYLRYKKFPPYGKDHYSDYIPMEVTGEGYQKGVDKYITKLAAPDASIVLPSLLSASNCGLGDNDSGDILIEKSSDSRYYGYYKTLGIFGFTISTKINTTSFQNTAVMFRIIMV